MDNPGCTPSTLSPAEARSRTGSVSSQILDMIGIKNGRVTEPGPGISRCEEDPDHLYKMRHPWSLYGASEDELKAGFERLRENLSKHHWKMVSYGPNNSKSKTLELTADYQRDRFSVNAELQISSPTAGKVKDPLILVNVVSGCFRVPEGTKLDQEY
jgi:hypothetical protein